MANSNVRSQQIGRALDLITAVAKGEAGAEDIRHPQDLAAELREQGIDSLDVLLEVLARASKASVKGRSSASPIDARSFAAPTPKDVLQGTKHKVPLVPFVLNGTLYDPKDINRFDGSELHMIGGGPGRDLVAFDDRTIIARFWETTYVASLTGPKDVSINKNRLRGLVTPLAGPEEFPTGVWPEVDDNGAYFYSDSGPDGWGSELFCPPNRGYARLSQVGSGFLGFGDWNDKISAFQGHNVYVVVLYEHSNWQGSTLSHYIESSLDYLGWNDRASGCACW